MKPREELSESLWMMAENCPAESEIERELKPYAIGRWVPVKERLPGAGWEGITKGHNKTPYVNERLVSLGWKFNGYDETDSDPTHWLELDLPEVTQ